MRPETLTLHLALCTSLACAAVLPAQRPADTPAPDTRSRIDAAVASAQARDKRIVLAWTASSDGAVLEKAITAATVRGQPFRYEFELVAVDASQPENAAMARLHRAGDARPWLTVLDGTGRAIAQQDVNAWLRTAALDQAALTEFLEAHKVPMPDADDVLAEGLARAKATSRNVLVHLAAPW